MLIAPHQQELPVLTAQHAQPQTPSIAQERINGDGSEKFSDKQELAMFNVSEVSSTHDDGPEVEWTPIEERRVRLKTDLVLMPLLFLGFYMYQVGSSPHH